MMNNYEVHVSTIPCCDNDHYTDFHHCTFQVITAHFQLCITARSNKPWSVGYVNRFVPIKYQRSRLIGTVHGTCFKYQRSQLSLSLTGRHWRINLSSLMLCVGQLTTCKQLAVVSSTVTEVDLLQTRSYNKTDDQSQGGSNDNKGSAEDAKVIDDN